MTTSQSRTTDIWSLVNARSEVIPLQQCLWITLWRECEQPRSVCAEPMWITLWFNSFRMFFIDYDLVFL